MSSNKIAVTMPGNTGDCIYALPTAKELCEQHGTTCDFYTSQLSAHVRDLFEYQPYIDRVIIPEAYRVERRDIGTQPWYMPVDEEDYSAVYQLGYRTVPDRALHQFMALYAGIDKPLKIEYTYPNIETPQTEYIIIAPRGSSSYAALFYDVGKKLVQLDYTIVIIGGLGENIFEVSEINDPAILDYTGQNMLQTVSMLSKASGFVGLMSSQLVLANGFQYPKVAPHDGIHWDMRHVVYSDSNFYPINPSVEEVLRLLNL